MNHRFRAAPCIALVATLVCAPALRADPNAPCIAPLLPPGDCNGNGVPDALDLASGTSADLNGNGIPDECEFCLALRQSSWLCPNGVFRERFSSVGTLIIDTIEPPDSDVLWINAVVNGRWVVRNHPLIAINGGGARGRYSIAVNLSVPTGTAISSAAASVLLSPDKLSAAPGNPPVSVPVCEALNTPWSITLSDPNDPNFPDPNEPNNWVIPGPNIPPVPDPNAGPGPNVPKRTARRREVGSVNEPVNHCAPGAGGRSMDWMNRTYCLGFPANCKTAQELHDKLAALMRTSLRSGTSIANIALGLHRLIVLKGMQNCLKVQLVLDDNPCKVFDAVAAGKDVVGLMTFPGRNMGHAIAVIGAVKCGKKVTIYFHDDAFGADNQGDGKADSGETKSAELEKTADGGYKLKGLGIPARWLGYVAVCPTRLKQAQALGKWLEGDPNDPSGDPNDPIIEGVIPRLERYALGDPPTQRELENLKKWVTKALDVACYLLEQALKNPGVDPQVIDDLIQIKIDLILLKQLACDLVNNFDPALLSEMLNLAQWAQMHLPRLVPSFDCNGNGIDDAIDILNGTLTDNDANGVPDQCQPPPCPGDTDGDGDVDLTDLANVLGNFGQVGAGIAGDVDNDGDVDLTDLAIVLGNFGQTCP